MIEEKINTRGEQVLLRELILKCASF